MRKLLLTLCVLAFIVACSSQHNAIKDNKRSIALNQKTTQDSIEYELIVFDIGFDSWFSYNDNEAQKRIQSYYEYKNRLYVLAWNDLFRQNNRLIDCFIDYDSTINYGFDLNYKLYMYFKYFEEKNRIKLINP